MNKKIIAIITAAVVVVAAIAIVAVSMINKNNDDDVEEETTIQAEEMSEKEEEKTDVAFSVKDKNLFMTVYPSGVTVQLTKNFPGIEQQSSLLSMYVNLSENGKKVFYLDDVTETNYTLYGNLYCVNVDKPEEEPLKIAENVRDFRVLEDKLSDSVAYISGASETLYYSNLQESKEIADYVSKYEYSPEHEAFFYSDFSGLYYKEAGSTAEKIADNVWTFCLKEDGETCYFTKFNYGTSNQKVTIYKKTIGMSVEQVTAGVSSDDFTHSEVFYEAGDAYYLKYIKGTDNMQTIPALCYYDGYAETIIQENVGIYNTCENQAVAVFSDNTSKMYLAEEDDILDITSVIGTLAEDTSYEVKVIDDGSFLVKKINYTTFLSELCRIVVEDGEITESGLYDSGVAYDDSFSVETESTAVYYKNVQDTVVDENIPVQEQSRSGDLYINKELIAQGVDVYRVCYSEELNKLCYFEGWNVATKTGTLKMYDGENKVVIADNVKEYQMTDDGNIVFIKNNTMFMYNDGEITELQSNVYSLPEIYHCHVNLSFI